MREWRLTVAAGIQDGCTYLGGSSVGRGGKEGRYRRVEGRIGLLRCFLGIDE